MGPQDVGEWALKPRGVPRPFFFWQETRRLEDAGASNREREEGRDSVRAPFFLALFVFLAPSDALFFR